MGEYQRAIELYKAARNKFVRIGDRLNEALTYRGLQGCYQALHVPTIAKNFKVRYHGTMALAACCRHD